MSRVAPYGTWVSSISAEMVAVDGVALSEPWLEDGSVYWQESRPAEGGRSLLMRAAPFSEPVEVTPKGSNVRTTVHEYGGGAYLIHRGTAFFSNFADQRLYRQDPGADPLAITPESGGRDRYADVRVTADGRWLICVRERHPDPDDPSGVTNELAAVPLDGSGEPLAIREGRDFYSTPRFSPDGSMLSWLEWDLPWMPWDGCEVYVAGLRFDGPLENVRHVAGRTGEESIIQPSWSPAGDLHFVSTGPAGGTSTGSGTAAGSRSTRQQRSSAGRSGSFGMSSYGFLEDGRIVCPWERGGIQHLAILDPESGELIDLDLPYSAMWPDLDVEGDRVAFVGGGPSIPDEIVLLDVTARSVDDRHRRALLLDPAADRIPDGGRRDRVRALLSASQRGCDRLGGRSAPAHREESRRADGRGHAELRSRDTVLDESRVRRRGRELRRKHRLRAGVPASIERQLGHHRHRRLHQSRAGPRRLEGSCWTSCARDRLHRQVLRVPD